MGLGGSGGGSLIYGGCNHPSSAQNAMKGVHFADQKNLELLLQQDPTSNVYIEKKMNSVY